MKIVCPFCFSVNNVPFKESYRKVGCGQCKESLLEATVLDLYGENFDEVLLNTDIPLVVDFWASWCGPCKAMAPVFEKVAEKFPLKAQFAKVQTDQESILSTRYDIRSIPTIVIFKNEKEVYRISGAMSEDALTKMIEYYCHT